ncbi:hypothetical protein COW53_04275 [bacterium CG17_big_fil_post_rev_8_21_14_2_50_64_8]|nr:MAG: hypothetical protein COW53_04275 [bacterium CG17_big_fil_post_rev_8_21_14_2_50_64_8]PJA73185.1 MAG: hypothetical protein CO151_14445 [bacterium CG_4_9_14_3_um_filter_65_15]
MDNTSHSAVDALRDSYLGGPGGVMGWFRSTDHKRVALMYLAWTAAAFVMAMILAMLPLMMALGGGDFERRMLTQVITYQRLIQVMGWMVPVLPGVLGFFLLPLQLGARNMALPVLSRLSLHFHVIGLLLLLASQIICPIGTGWTMDSRLAMLEPGAFEVLLVGLFFMAMSWMLTGINFVVTVHHGRRQEMGFFDMPLTVWGMYVYGYLLIFSGAVFAAVALFMTASRITTTGLFGWEADPMVWRSYFWFSIRPVAYFALIPGVGILSDLISGISRRTSPGYRLLVGSMIALAGLAVASSGVALIGRGLDPGSSLVFSFFSLLVLIPAALIGFTWLSTLYRGSITLSPAAFFALGFLLHAGIAVGMGMLLASPSLGSYLGTSLFASAQLDYILWGGVMAALLAGLHFWWPKMVGRNFVAGVANLGAVLYIVGLNLALVPRVIMGTQGVPEDAIGLVSGFLAQAQVSGLGWLIVYSGLGVTAGNLLASIWSGDAAEVNPWGAVTLEWTVPSPPPEGNFDG